MGVWINIVGVDCQSTLPAILDLRKLLVIIPRLAISSNLLDMATQNNSISLAGLGEHRMICHFQFLLYQGTSNGHTRHHRNYLQVDG